MENKSRQIGDKSEQNVGIKIKQTCKQLETTFWQIFRKYQKTNPLENQNKQFILWKLLSFLGAFQIKTIGTKKSQEKKQK